MTIKSCLDKGFDFIKDLELGLKRQKDMVKVEDHTAVASRHTKLKTLMLNLLYLSTAGIWLDIFYQLRKVYE